MFKMIMKTDYVLPWVDEFELHIQYKVQPPENRKHKGIYTLKPECLLIHQIRSPNKRQHW